MTAQFAGSRSLDDRRRRRLAQESTEEVASQPSKQKRQAKKSSETESKPEKVRLVSDVVADESLVPSALWKVIAFAVIGFSILSTLVLDQHQRALPQRNRAFTFSRSWKRLSTF